MNKYLKYILPLLITFLLGWFLFRHGIRWNDLQAVIQRASWRALFLALLFQAASYSAVTFLNQILLQSYGAVVPFSKQFAVQLAMAFIEALVPSASISGVALRARLLRPHGVSADVATATVVTEGSLILASVVLPAFLLAGFGTFHGMYSLDNLGNWLVFGVGSGALLGISLWKWNAQPFSNFRKRLLNWLSEVWEKYFQSRWPATFGTWSAARIIQRGHYLWAETVSAFRNRPYAILMSLTARSGFEALCLGMCFYALGTTLPFITLVLIYSLTIAINTLGAIPGGVGLAEVSLSTLYAQLGISAEIALTIALAYRMIGYWLPRVVGGLAWLWIEQLNPQPSNSEVIP